MKLYTSLFSLCLLLLFAGCDEPVPSGKTDMELEGDASVIELDVMVTDTDQGNNQELDQVVNPELDQEPVDGCATLGSCSSAGGWCEPLENPECWAGGAPVCYNADHPLSQRYCADTPITGEHGCACPSGYEVSSNGDACVRIETVAAIQNDGALSVCAAEDNFNYGKFGALFPNTDGNGSNDYLQNEFWGMNDGQNNGRLNQVGVWACDEANAGQTTHEPIDEWIGFSHCLVVEESGDYLLGIAGDNRVRLKVDGQLIFEKDNDDSANFAYWHINRISLTSGVHFIELFGRNDHQVAAFGAEISGPFPAGSLLNEEAMKSADYEGKLIFSTQELIDQGIFDLGTNSGWQCPEGNFALNTCGESPTCTSQDVIACEEVPVPPTPEVDCDQAGRCAPNGSWCESVNTPECWAGDTPVCWPPEHPISIRQCGEDLMDDTFCICPEGFATNPNGDGCIRVSQSEATFHGQRYQVCDADGSSAYGWGGALYQDTDGNPTNDNVIDAYWGSTSAVDDQNGRLNQIGIWACNSENTNVGSSPVDEWIGFSHCLAVEEAGDYLVGIAGDNRVRLKVNGTLAFELDNDQTRNFNYWHMRKISLSSGINNIELSGLNDGLIAAFGAEISGPFPVGTVDTEEAQKTADYAGNIIFSTGDLHGQLFDLGESSGWSCPDGAALNTCAETPVCSTTETAECLNIIEPMTGCKHNADNCDDNAICVDTDEGYDCICSPGYEGDGTSCTPVPCPENASGAPECSCDEGFVGILTFDYENNTWLGDCEPADPCDEVLCPRGQLCDPVTLECIDCSQEYTCVNGSYCESARYPSCWAGDAPVCYEPSHSLSQTYCDNGGSPSLCECPEGFEASVGQDSCIRVNSVEAVFNGTQYQVCDAYGNRGYGWAGALYEDTDGDDSNNAVVDQYWGQQGSSSLGRLNQVGIWSCIPDNPNMVGTDPLNEWIGFSHCLSIESAGDYLIGIAGDNRVRFKVNGQMIFERDNDDTTNFNYWHIRKVSLQSGVNVIELSGYNDHAVAAFGAEISGPFAPGSLDTEAAQKAADYAGNIIFSTSRMEGQLFDIGEASGWSCPGEGQALNTCSAEPECSSIERVDCLDTPPVDCSRAFECVNGSYCEIGNQPACWQGENPVCYGPDHPLSQANCPDPVDCSEAYECVNGAYCETGDEPECWRGDEPVCYPVDSAISLEHCALDPCDGVICARGELCEPTTGECVDCSQAYECVNGSYCESGDSPVCWAGDAPMCYVVSHPLSQQYCNEPSECICPDGFNPTPNQEICVQSTSVEAINNATRYQVCPATDSSAYGWGGALFADTDGDTTNNRIINDYFTQRLNNVGIWACGAVQGASGTTPVDEWIGFSRCIDIAVGGDYLIGIAGDNQVRFKVNGQLIFERTGDDTANFNYWHIIKVSLNSGVNVIELSGRNNENIAAFGAEISGPFPAGSLESEAQQMRADYAGNIIFSTGDMEGEVFDIGENSGWSCPDESYALNLCAATPQCTLTTYAECDNAQVNECDDGTDECDANASCVDEAVGYSCVCNPGYLGNGLNCRLAECPDNASSAPNCTCDEGYEGVLSFDPVNGWQGSCEPIDLCDGIICQVGEVCDPDTGNCVNCDRSFECVNGSYCEIGNQPACWQGENPVCYGPDHPLSQANCPDPVDCSEAYECVNGAYCEAGDEPECWRGDEPVCYPVDSAISLEHCALDPCDGVICARGELCEPTTGECVDCSQAYECVNGSYCESGDSPVCWAGDAPMCYVVSHPLSQQYCNEPSECICPDGFNPTPNQEICVQSTSVEAINNATRYQVCPATDSSAYGWGGALFADTDGDTTNNRIINDYFTQRLNNVGIWACGAVQGASGTTPIDEWIGFSRCIDIAVGGDYLIGIAGDNQVRFKVNGQLIFERTGDDTANFNYWHIIKVSLNSGVNVIELSGRNNENIAAFGAEISGPFPAGSLESEAQQMRADYAGNIIFSTGDMEGEVFDIGENSGWSCPDESYALNLCAATPQCTLTTYAECDNAQVNECDDGTDECDANASCVDEAVGYSCVCNPGYLGDGLNCVLAECPDNASGAPNCRCNRGYEGVLSFDPVNGWQGSCEPIDLCDGIICQVGEVCDPDTGNCVNCDRSFECVEGQYCEIGNQPACWQGDTPACYGVDHPLSIENCPQTPTCNCPRGYTPTPANDACVQTLNTPAENNAVNYSVCDADGSTAYGWGGALYQDLDGDLSNNIVNDPYWGVSNSTVEGRLNTVGIWACDGRFNSAGSSPIDEWIGFSQCLNIEVGGDYLIGIAGDNRVRFKVDGAMVFELNSSATSNFNYWHVRKVSLTSGIHVIELSGRNDGNVAAFGAEISGPFPVGSLDNEVSLQQADYAGNIIFSTEEMVGQTFDIGETSGWTCPEGQTLNTCEQPPSCTSINYTSCL